MGARAPYGVYVSLTSTVDILVVSGDSALATVWGLSWGVDLTLKSDHTSLVA